MKRYVVTYTVSQPSHEVYDLAEMQVVRRFWRKRHARKLCAWLNQPKAEK